MPVLLAGLSTIGLARPARVFLIQSGSLPNRVFTRQRPLAGTRTVSTILNLKGVAAFWIGILRKEVIQPQVPLRLPCYDLVPIAEFILDTWFLAVTSVASDAPHFRGLTGGVYKAQEHIHRGMLTRDY